MNKLFVSQKQAPRHNKLRSIALCLAAALLSTCAAPKPYVTKPQAQVINPIAPPKLEVEQPKKIIKRGITDQELAELFNPFLSFGQVPENRKHSYRKYPSDIEETFHKLRTIIETELGEESNRSELAKIKISLVARAISGILYNFYVRMRSTWDYYKYEEKLKELHDSVNKICNRINPDNLQNVAKSYPVEDFKQLSNFFATLDQIISAPAATVKPLTDFPLVNDNSVYNALANAFIRCFNDLQHYIVEQIMYEYGAGDELNKRFPTNFFNGVNINPNFPKARLRLVPPFERPVIINIWSPGCAPCISEMPDLNRIHGDGTAFVIGYQVNSFGFIETAEGITNAIERGSIPDISYPILNAPFGDYFRISNKVRDIIGYRDVLPKTIIIGRKGRVKGLVLVKIEEQELRYFLSEMGE